MSTLCRFCPVLLVFLLAGFVCQAQQVKPLREWKGTFKEKADEPMMKEAPTSRYIANAKAWDKLWKAWRRGEAVPKVDFEKELVLVGAATGARNRISADFRLTDQGDLRGGFTFTEIGGPGFVYLIVVVNREGVKSYNGKPIEKD